jgi:hypothetical protein
MIYARREMSGYLPSSPLSRQNVSVSPAVESILQQVNGLSLEDQKELWDRLMTDEAARLDQWEQQVARDQVRQARSSFGRVER